MSQAPSAREVPGGGYRFLPGIAPFSSGAAASPGHQVVHATLRAPIPWREGFVLIDRHLHAEAPSARRAVRHRAPEPGTVQLRGIRRVQRRVSGTARRVEAPGRRRESDCSHEPSRPSSERPPSPRSTGFGYTIPGASARPTFIVAGAGEMRDRGVGAEGIVRHGETSADADARESRARDEHDAGAPARLGVGWADVTTIDIYTAQPIESFVADTVLRPGRRRRDPRRALVSQPASPSWGSSTRWTCAASPASLFSRRALTSDPHARELPPAPG
jgi:hypothetical protein